MFSRYKKFVQGGVMLVLFLLLVACSSPGSNSNTGSTGSTGTSNQGSPAATPFTPRQITPKANSSSGSKGPQVVTGQIAVPGGKVGNRQIVLSDRILIINSIGKQKGTGANSTLVNLDLTVQNTSNKTIMNSSSFFLLMGPEGDTFNYQYNSSDNFYGTVAAHTTRQGSITFQVPTTATTTNLSLMYRSEIVAETAIVSLKIA